MPDEMNQEPMERPERGMYRGPGRPSVMPWAILLVVILAVLIAAVMFRDRIMPKNDSGNKNNATETLSGYQSVFLVNGQVYFGKLSGVNDQFLTLKDVYYLQLVQPPGLQGSQQANQQTTQTSQSQPQLTLRKLGRDELHGPVDVMKINRDQILFYEDIKEEGAVMKAIRNDQANPPAAKNDQSNTNTQQQAPANTTPETPSPANNAPANTNTAPKSR